MLAEYTSDDTGNWKHWSTQPVSYKQHKNVTWLILLEKASVWGWDWQKGGTNLDFVFPTLWPGCQFLSLMSFLFCDYFLVLWCLLHLIYTNTIKTYFDCRFSLIIVYNEQVAKSMARKRNQHFCFKTIMLKILQIHSRMLEHSLWLH